MLLGQNSPIQTSCSVNKNFNFKLSLLVYETFLFCYVCALNDTNSITDEIAKKNVCETIPHDPFEKSLELLQFKVANKNTRSVASFKFHKELFKASV